MGVIPEKFEYKNCPRERATHFVEEILQKGLCKRVSQTQASEKSHLDRYGFVCANRKVSVVYDLKANLLSVTAYDDVAPALKKLYDEIVKSQTKSAKKDPSKEKQAKQSSQRKQEPVKKQISPKKQEPVKKQEPLKKQEETDESGGISLKKYTTARYNDLVKKLRSEKKKYKISDETVLDKGKPTELISNVISGGGVKLKLRYMPKKQVLQLQGKHGALFSELRLLLSEQTDYKSAVSAHIEQEKSDNNATKIERQLKKLMPSAYRFLSEQAKIDFTIGIIEIINSNAEHYDYSMLLLPPFRGLERLIFDLQRAQNVLVKMIGQAYEKEEGKYVLKASYRRKINSIVYAEVMASLYREYFEKRNYYTHSDSIGEEVRVINKRDQALSIFTAMLEKVEYNCKKLTEIGFSI